MSEKDYTERAKQAALKHGADLVGVVKVEDLPEHSERIERMLPGARSVLVVASSHSLASLRSGANELAQFDTIHAYNESARACHAAARSLESSGFLASGVPAFIPLDMEAPGKGMRGGNMLAQGRCSCRSGVIRRIRCFGHKRIRSGSASCRSGYDCRFSPGCTLEKRRLRSLHALRRGLPC